eukprot:9044758-Pyramimonas_sp.AAC.1
MGQTFPKSEWGARAMLAQNKPWQAIVSATGSSGSRGAFCLGAEISAHFGVALGPGILVAIALRAIAAPVLLRHVPLPSLLF